MGRRLRRYNCRHFWLRHMLADLARTARGAGPRAGEPIPVEP